MTPKGRLRSVTAVAVASALAFAGCGGNDEESGPSPTSTAAVANPSQDYRDRLVPILQRATDARSTYHHAPAGDASQIAKAARRLARASAATARDIAQLRPPMKLEDLNRRLSENYQQQTSEIEAELDHKPLSTGRLGDVIRKHEKASDDLYQQILTAP